MNKNFVISLLAIPSLLAGLFGGHSGIMTLQANAGGNGTAVNVPSGDDTSLNWSGYAATGGTFTGIGAGWTVPAATAATSSQLSADATWVGIGGVVSRDLIQAGTQTVFQGGSPQYEAWYELLPSDSIQVPLTIHPGDAVTVAITEASNADQSNEWQISFTDATTGQNYATSVSYQSSLSSAEWIEEMPSDTSGFVSLDNFGTASFTGGYAIENGSSTNISGTNAASMTMVNGAGQALTIPSSLGVDGASFSVARTAASSGGSTISVMIGRGGRWTRTGVGPQGFTRRTRQLGTSSSFGSSFGFNGFPGFGNFGGAYGNLQGQLNALETQLQAQLQSMNQSMQGYVRNTRFRR